MNVNENTSVSSRTHESRNSVIVETGLMRTSFFMFQTKL